MGRRPEGLNHYLRADVERGFILAYYKYVERCAASLDGPYRDGDPFVATAVRPGLGFGMDFSTYYQFPENMRPATAAQRMKAKAELLQQYAALWKEHNRGEDGGFAVRYEVWCFIPPERKVLYAYNQALQEQLPVYLVAQEEVAARLRQTVLAVPRSLKNQDNITAFAECAVLFREAFGLISVEGRVDTASPHSNKDQRGPYDGTKKRR